MYLIVIQILFIRNKNNWISHVKQYEICTVATELYFAVMSGKGSLRYYTYSYAHTHACIYDHKQA